MKYSPTAQGSREPMDQDPPSYTSASVYPSTSRIRTDFIGLVPAGRFSGYVDSCMFTQVFPHGYFVPGLVFIPRNSQSLPQPPSPPHSSIVVPYDHQPNPTCNTSLHNGLPDQTVMNHLQTRPGPWRQSNPRRL